MSLGGRPSCCGDARVSPNASFIYTRTTATVDVFIITGLMLAHLDILECEKLIWTSRNLKPSSNSWISTVIMSEPSMPPSDNVANKRKRESTDSAGPEPQRNRSSNASNGSIQGSDQSNFQQNSLGSYDHNLPNTNDHGIPNSSSELNIDQQILQHVGTQNGITDDNALTAKAALAAHTPQNKYPAPPDAPFDANNLTHGLSFGDDIGQGISGGHNHNSTAAAVYAAREAQSMNSKPSVGSPEWHQVRKNNHKEGTSLNPVFFRGKC